MKLASEKLLTTVKDIEIYANNDKQYELLINKIKSGNFAPNITFEDPGIKEFFYGKGRLTLVQYILIFCFEDKEPRIVLPQNVTKRITCMRPIKDQQ